MTVRSIEPTPVRTLVSPAHNIDDPSTLPPSAFTGTGTAGLSEVVKATPRKSDHFINIVASRAASEVNPHLWAWQAEALDAWHQAGCRGVVEAVTGAGKTMIGITAAFEAFRQGIKVLVLVPTAELQTQWQQRLMETLPQADVGTLGNGRTDSLSSCDILVAIINSATRGALLSEQSHGMLIADECHRYAAKTFAQALQSEFNYRLGLTATYQRPDNANSDVLDPYFGGVVFHMWYDRALRDGVIAQFDIAFVGVTLTDSERGEYQVASSTVSKLGMSLKNKLDLQYAPFDQFMSSVQTLAGRKHDRSPIVFMARKYLEAVVKRQRVLTNAKNKMKVLDGIAPVIADSKGTLVFSQTVDSSTQAAQLLQRAGIETKAVSSESKPHERRGAMQLFANGIAKVLCAPRILDEGIDVPDSDLAVVLSGSKQPRQTIQRLGRIIRRKKNGGHGRFLVLYAVNTIEDEKRNKEQQFGAILPSARRIADFNETQIRELRKFLRAPAPELPNAPAQPGGGPSELTGKTPASELDGAPHILPPSDEDTGSTFGPDSPDVGPQSFVLLKDVDEDDEPRELLRNVPDPDDLVRLYLYQIGQFPLLTAAEEVEVAKRIEAGLYASHLLALGRYSTRRERHDLEWVRADGQAALDQMVSSNLRLVVSIAKKYISGKLSFLDLIQEGNLGLVKAVQKFDFSRGIKFSTYATWWVRQGIDRGIGDFTNTIRIPIHLGEKFPEYWSCTKDEASLKACEHDHSKVEEALRMQPVSLESYLDLQWDGHYAESQKSFDDRIATPEVFTDDPETRIIDAEYLEAVNSVIDSLPGRDAEIVRRRFGWFNGELQTLDAIGKPFNLTRERIRQIEKQSLARLHDLIEGHSFFNGGRAALSQRSER
ncbi:sigma-70 family RNA polymerase sigma factor [Brevibacterium sp. BDJS002]|uniref:sigma-70 family RNA polymerase sigma factor n=1 Tax=Brevibacterium sp. BDJS002 TaxID=3020906 RepID=UPI0023072687|nr:sigma-70 family RNA polymerase sigma factor [Brevibacterium sp. BDJS002]WCE38818.1 sigma-70 family RNA polymerase sigma factor [Brevibacterium sp. BDJS002]